MRLSFLFVSYTASLRRWYVPSCKRKMQKFRHVLSFCESTRSQNTEPVFQGCPPEKKCWFRLTRTCKFLQIIYRVNHIQSFNHHAPPDPETYLERIQPFCRFAKCQLQWQEGVHPAAPARGKVSTHHQTQLQHRWRRCIHQLHQRCTLEDHGWLVFFSRPQS